jgi:hypothetical protein
VGFVECFKRSSTSLTETKLVSYHIIDQLTYRILYQRTLMSNCDVDVRLWRIEEKDGSERNGGQI